MTASQPADPLREALDAHEWRVGWRDEQDRPIWGCMCGWKSQANTSFVVWADHREAAVRAALGDHATLGSAWASVEAALPEGWTRVILQRGTDAGLLMDTWHAVAEKPDSEPNNGDGKMRTGPTPEAALHALHAALTEKKP